MNTAVYVRVSTEGQRTDSQELELKRYCRQRGWKNVTFYADKISGAKASRPQLDRMMQDIRAWTNLTVLSGDGSLVTVTNFNAASGQRFYRVETQ